MVGSPPVSWRSFFDTSRSVDILSPGEPTGTRHRRAKKAASRGEMGSLRLPSAIDTTRSARKGGPPRWRISTGHGMDTASGPHRERQPPRPSLPLRGIDCYPSAARPELLRGHPPRQSAATATTASGPATLSPGGELGGRGGLLPAEHDGHRPWGPPLESTGSRRAHLSGWPGTSVGCYSSQGFRARLPSLLLFYAGDATVVLDISMKTARPRAGPAPSPRVG